MPYIRAFFEYRIRPENREDYLHLMKKVSAKRLSQGFDQYTLTEALARKNQFVETFLVGSMEEYREKEAKLLEDPEMQSSFQTLDTYIEGGPETKKVWFFEKVEFAPMDADQ